MAWISFEASIKQIAGCEPGFIGPLGLDITIIVDHAAAHLTDFVCGANQNHQHLKGVNWVRDLPEPDVADLRNVVEGDNSPDGQGHIIIKRGIEVGHIFQLGDKYSKALNSTVLNEQGKATVMTMGCYGIGVNRIIAAAIELHNDKKGIIWPASITPFQVIILPIN